MTEPDPALSRAAAIPLLALAVVFVNENCSAESLALDPLTASVTVYGVSLDPTVSVSVDVSTTRFAVHAAGEIYVSMPSRPSSAAPMQSNRHPEKWKICAPSCGL